MSNADLAKTAKNPNRWRDLEIELKGIIEPSGGVVLLSYEGMPSAKTVSFTRRWSAPVM